MASPRTRRVLSDLKPKDDNNVSQCYLLSSTDYLFIFHLLLFLNSTVLSVMHSIHNGHLFHMVSGFVWIVPENIVALAYI